MLAIGELQKEAGQDQRIAARAEILDALPTTPAVDGVKQTHWTGVWKTGKKPTEDQRTESIGTNRSQSARWLVSNPNPNASPPLDPASYSGTMGGNDPNALLLAKNLGVDGSEVTVPLVKVPGTTGRPGGSYAYWVSDEGIKAKANLVDPTFASCQPAIDHLHHMAPHANAMHKVLPMATPDTDFRVSPSASIAKLITADTVKLLPTVAMTGSLAHYSPDFTVASQGVIADVRNGVEERSDRCVGKPGRLCQSPHQPLQWCLEALSIFKQKRKYLSHRSIR